VEGLKNKEQRYSPKTGVNSIIIDSCDDLDKWPRTWRFS
jgi:hypothetical protein